jgi:hypothetical protein
MSLVERLPSLWCRFQQNLFPFLNEEVGPLTETHHRLVIVLDVACIEAFVHAWPGLPGRPPAERRPLARAFVAKSILNLSTTKSLIERLLADKALRRLCGWERLKAVPSESTFSRAFAEFAESNLPGLVQETLIKDVFKNRLVGHISRDATAIEAREKPAKPSNTDAVVAASPSAEPLIKASEPPAEAPSAAVNQTPSAPRRRGRPRKGEVSPPKELRRLEKQVAGLGLEEMLADLPKHCDVGTKRNSKGYKTSWIGYKLHIDTADGDIPLSCILTSASIHDSQVAIPLATMTAARGVVNCYDLMDAAYDAPEIRAHSKALGHVPIIDINPRSNKILKEELAQEAKRLTLLGYTTAEDIRYNERSAAERVNSQLKDSYGGSTVRVRGPVKVACHLMFGVLAITVLQIMRLTT